MEDKKRVYLVDDEGMPLKKVLNRHLGNEFEFDLEENIEPGVVIKYLKEHPEVLVVLLDIYQKAEPKGLAVLDAIKQAFGGEVRVIAISGKGDYELAVTTIKKGAIEYLPRDQYENLSDPDIHNKIKQKIMGAWQKAHGKRTYREVKDQGVIEYADMIGTGPKMKEVFGVIELCAKTKAVVLITGETGTGKELVAKAIHQKSNRSKAAYRPINIAAIPRYGNFLQQTLFGRTRDATRKGDVAIKGIFLDANGGTVFLDEIGSADRDVQTALLRVIENGQILPLGANEPMDVDCRLIFGTNEDLEAAIKDKGFREDLYHRINVIRIELPPLKERKEDIPYLVERFLRKFCQEYSKEELTITNEDMNRLCEHEWRGNVRVLENVIERSVILTPIPTPKQPTTLMICF